MNDLMGGGKGTNSVPGTTHRKTRLFPLNMELGVRGNTLEICDCVCVCVTYVTKLAYMHGNTYLLAQKDVLKCLSVLGCELIYM